MSTRALLASPFGFLIGVSLGALGGGGSILAVPVLVFIAGQAPAAATTTSLVVVGVASLIGAYGHWRAGRVLVVPGLIFGLVGIGGSLTGSALNRRLDGDVLLLAFAALVLIAAWRMAVAKKEGPDADTSRGGLRVWSPGRVAKMVAAGTVVGFLTGLFGVGGGFVIVPALALLLRFPMASAIGTSLLVIAVNTAVALTARIGAGPIDWATTLVFTAAAIAGVGAGKKVADRVDSKSLQKAFAVLLVGVALYTGARALVALF